MEESRIDGKAEMKKKKKREEGGGKELRTIRCHQNISSLEKWIRGR
jgi:hypothetical protein